MEGGFVFVSVSFALACPTGVAQVLGYAVRPAVSDWFSCCIVALADEGSLFGFCIWTGFVVSFGSGCIYSLSDEGGDISCCHRVGCWHWC